MEHRLTRQVTIFSSSDFTLGLISFEFLILVCGRLIRALLFLFRRKLLTGHLIYSLLLSFWIQIHNVPFQCMTREMAVQLGSVLGFVEKVDCDGRMNWVGAFLCIWV